MNKIETVLQEALAEVDVPESYRHAIIDAYNRRAALSAKTEAQPVACHKKANDYCKCSRNAMLCDGVGPAPLPQQESQLLEAAEKDAARGRYMIENGGWHRDDRDQQTLMTVLVPYGSDLSCLATRRDAIDSAIAASKGGAS